MAVVTISRLFGIGGREFGWALAQRLGYAYLDREILGDLAEKSGSREDTVALYEGMPQGPTKLVQDFWHRKFPGARPTIMEPVHYTAVLRAVIEEYALRDRVVIVGRGGQCILTDHPRAIHLRLIANREHLVRRLATLRRFAGLPETELWRRSESYRESRRGFVRQHFGCDAEDPLLYHLVMNFSRVTPAEAVEIVAGMVGRRDSGCRPA
jgi:hypothetical protein